jgi:hypothetical protein
MLIDDVLSHRGFDRARAEFPMLSSLRSAQVFVLTEDAVHAASHLMATAASPTTVSSLFRLPYPVVWLEAAVNGAKVGIFLDGGGSAVENLHFAAGFVRADTGVGIKAAGIFEPGTLEFSFGNAARQYSIRCQPLQAMLDKSPRAHDMLVSTVATAMSAVAIINSRAVSYTDPSDLAQLNAARSRRGRPPLIDFHTVRIRDELARTLRQTTSSAEPDGVRLHWRRGHFKARKSGLYWWNPHLAGRKELGYVEKDYVT